MRPVLTPGAIDVAVRRGGMTIVFKDQVEQGETIDQVFERLNEKYFGIPLEEI